MKIACPHCGKNMDISGEELATRDNMVVCPQCLLEFTVEGVKLPANRKKQADDARVAVCPNCGRELHSLDEMRFCYFCGASLQDDGLPEQQQVNEQPQPQPQPVRYAEHHDATGEAAEPHADVPHPIVYSYAYTKSHGQRMVKAGGGRHVRIIAYFIIILLIVMFGVIIYAANTAM